jgi:hypothetical protein
MTTQAALLAQVIRDDEGWREFASQCLRPEVRVKALAGLAGLRKVFDGFARVFERFAPPEGLIEGAKRIGRVLSEPREAEYEQALIAIGYEKLEARAVSIGIVGAARRSTPGFDRNRRKLASALREVREAVEKSPSVISRRAQVLFPALDDTEIAKPLIENSLSKAGLRLSFEEFQAIAANASRRDPAACRELASLVRQIFEHVPKARGRSLSMMTVTHALLLYAAHMAGHCRAYTYCPAAEDFVDRLTIATRRKFGQPGFNPRESIRLLRRLKWDRD